MKSMMPYGITGLERVKRIEFVSDVMLYIILRGRWCNTVVLNVHATSEEKSDGVSK